MSFMTCMAAAAAEQDGVWSVVAQLLVLLAAAFALGTLFEKLRQSAILGYLLAGTLLGPHVLNMLGGEGAAAVHAIAELGVAVLLFTIGLEFSIKQLLRVGPVGLGGGTLQVIITLAVTAGVGMAFGLNGSAAIAVGAIVALSSTATVIRIMVERASIESTQGRASVGILLLQDVAVVPLVLIVTLLGGEGTASDVFAGLGKALLLITAMIVTFYIGSRLVQSRVLRERALVRNRELLILLASVMGIGSAVAAHMLDLSPALGAFVAGLMLAESPFALQIRSDIAALRTLFVTLFFVSIGMLGDPMWIAENAGAVTATVGMIVIGKVTVITGIALMFGYHLRHAVPAGLYLAQVGEFSFVIAEVARQEQIINDPLFRLMVSATLLTLFLTPYMITIGPTLGEWLERRRRPQVREPMPGADEAVPPDHVIVVGFGPSGEEVVESLRRRGASVLVVDLHSRNVQRARRMGLMAIVGDAGSGEVWEHLHVDAARAVVITIPDHQAAMQAISQIKLVASNVPIIARARYHGFVPELTRAGAEAVVDEEYLTGRRLAVVVSGMVGTAAALDDAEDTEHPDDDEEQD